MRAAYRLRQFWQALFAKPTPAGLAPARALLSPAQMALFSQLQPSEQVHALQVLSRLAAQGETQPDLLVAALLHDIGKLRAPLRPWERASVVLGKRLFPARVQRWGAASQPQDGWRRAFVAAQQHPAWGAALARSAGVSLLTEALIRRHQQPPAPGADSLEDNLLRKLQAVDNES